VRVNDCVHRCRLVWQYDRLLVACRGVGRHEVEDPPDANSIRLTSPLSPIPLKEPGDLVHVPAGDADRCVVTADGLGIGCL